MRNFFEGRLARLAFFWRWIVSSFLASLVSLMIESQATDPQTGTVTTPLDGVSIGLVIATVAGLFLAAYQLSLIARRLRSAGLNPWLTLLYLVPVANIVIFLICLFKSPSEESRPEFHEARNGTVLPPSSPVPGSASSRNTSLGGVRDDDSVSVADAFRNSPSAGQETHVEVSGGEGSPDVQTKIEQLQKLAALKASGVISEEEFERLKAKVLQEKQ